MRALLRVLSIAIVVAVSGSAQCLSAPSTSTMNGVTYHLWIPVTSSGLPCGNGDLVIYAHGYVTPGLPPATWLNELSIGGVFLPAALNQAGYAVAASDYSKTGLAIIEGMQDTLALASAARNAAIPALPPPVHTFLIGASEGGLVTTLSAEQVPGIYKSAGAACGPIGSFQSQLNYFGDFRVLFDYFFPNVIPGSPVSAVDTLAAAAQWQTLSTVAIPDALQNTPKTQQLFRVMGIPLPSDPGIVLNTVLEVLAYNVFGTADAQHELGGQPYDNHTRIYIGSSNDLLLNILVKRFKADPSALANVAAHYETSGKLMVPLVTIHTLSDPVIPYWHELLYTAKTLFAGDPLKRVNLPVSAYGHCNFTSEDILAAFALTVLRSTGTDPSSTLRAALPEALQSEFNAAISRHQAAASAMQ
jgi:pimeloyl-ACP methyl ester carboxylesterase